MDARQPARRGASSRIATALLILLLLLALLAFLLSLQTNRELSTQVTSLQARVDRLEAAGGQQVEATRVLAGKVELVQVALKEHEDNIRLLRQDADRVSQQAQAIQTIQSRMDKVTQQAEALDALRSQVAAYVGSAQALQEDLTKQATLVKVLQGRGDDLATTVGQITKSIEGINEQLSRPQLPGFPLPLFGPIRP